MGTTIRRNVNGLDTIRFICAIWVVIAHCGSPPILEGIDKSNPIGFIINAIYANVWSGPSAVIVFFVISGFCIHYPQSGQLRISNLPGYFLRRYLRVGIPFIITIILSKFLLKLDLSSLNESIFWSIFAEIIYYTIYPLILKIRRNGFSWQQITVASFLVAIMISATNPTAGNYPSFGIGLNWLLGLPCWLLGVQLAELVVEDNQPKPKNIWVWRIAILIASCVCSVLRFHSPLGYPWTLNFFAIFVFFWLLQEIRFYRYETPPGILEWMGKWSYSIYLIHLLGQSIWLVTLREINLGYYINWMVNIAFVLLCSYLFALAVEFPTHKLARSIAYRIKAKNNF